VKNKDQILLEKTYLLIFKKEEQRLIEEGKMADFLKRLGGGANKVLQTIKNKVLTNPRLIKNFTIAAPVLFALASGNVAQAAEYGSDAVNDLISQLSQAAADGSINDTQLQEILTGWEQKQNSSTAQTNTYTAQDAVNQGIKSTDQTQTAVDSFNSSGDLDQLSADLRNLNSLEDIKNKLFSFVSAVKLSGPESFGAINAIEDIQSIAKYENIDSAKLKQIILKILNNPEYKGLKGFNIENLF